MDTDKANLLAAMYDQDDNAKPPAAIEQTSFSRSRKIRVGIIEYEVPTMEYVNRLEQVIANQTQTIQQHQRVLARTNAMLAVTRNFLRRQTQSIHEIHTELDTKIGIQE